MNPLPGAAADGLCRVRLPGRVDLAALAERDPRYYPFLLESVSPAIGQPGYDILFACPGETLEFTDAGLTGPGSAKQGAFLEALDAWWAEERIAADADDLPFTGGWFVYLGYELAGEVEPGLTLDLPRDLPIAFATRIPAAVINDHACGETVLVAEPGSESALERMQRDLERVCDGVATVAVPDAFRVEEDAPEVFLDAVGTAKAAIAAGDIYQANLSRQWRVTGMPRGAAVALYRRLRETNPAPFAGLLQRDDFTLVSSSPERLVRRHGRRLDTRPIAGTRPRTGDSDEALRVTSELLAHPKERAEHVMLIDLERNDLGRVCVGGSVQVDEFMVIETYSHVHHIVSNVTGIARPGLTPGELLRAVFPGGTITGCPKVRCMQIIHELEQRPRGAYTGSMGYLNRNGDCDFNILIRTLTLKGDTLELAAGSGIVADSEPEHELAETRAKAKGLLLALGAAAS